MVATDQIIVNISDKLLSTPQQAPKAEDLRPDWKPEVPVEQPPVEAAVLIALVARDHGYSILYTERSSDLRSHSGQIAFPGGKLDPEDANAGAAAIREASEEVDLTPTDADIIGYLPHYYTGTNYLITPVVALVTPRTPFIANPLEVQSMFEVPLPLIASESAYETHHVYRNDKEHTTWKIGYEGKTIWGITANLTRRFRDTALDEGAFK